MLVGVPKEIKNHEYRVGLSPESVGEVVGHGHRVVVETGAGSGIGAGDEDYRASGAEILESAHQVFERAEMVVKVKEPQPNERAWLRSGQVLFTYLHLAPDPDQTHDLVASDVVAIAYETVTGRSGGLPLLAPMSEVAGRLSIQAGAHFLERENGGKGILIGGVPGVAPAKVLIIGAGTVGTHAADTALGMGANVWIVDRSADALKAIWRQFGGSIDTVFSTQGAIAQHVANADLVVGSVLIPGAAAPKLVTRPMIQSMSAGSVVVDVAIDQGGCFETSKATTHAEPTFEVDGVVHYCVANMPGAVPRTSTYALNNVTLPFVLELANKGYRKAMEDDPHLLDGLNVHRGQVTQKAVAENLGLTFRDPREAIRH
jgi:alanine dehydrogenase